MNMINIPELFRTLTSSVNDALSDIEVFFDYGHYMEVTRNLSQKDQGISNKDRKYPLIWLVMDFTERYGHNTAYCELPDLSLIIATATNKDSSTPERMEQNFVPILYPIYSELINQIQESGFFHISDFQVAHEKIDRPYWDGKEAQGGANLFNDFIDAIQIRRMNLIVNQEACGMFKLLAA